MFLIIKMLREKVKGDHGYVTFIVITMTFQRVCKHNNITVPHVDNNDCFFYFSEFVVFAKLTTYTVYAQYANECLQLTELRGQNCIVVGHYSRATKFIIDMAIQFIIFMPIIDHFLNKK